MEQSREKIVFCAEDDPDDMELFCEEASRIDPSLNIMHCDNGLQVLEKLESLTAVGKLPCLISLDMNMPAMGGRETIEKIKAREEWADIPICIYSTSPRHLYLDLELKYGVVVVTKPDNLDDITQTVNFVLSHCK